MFDLDGTLTTCDTLLPLLRHYGLARRKYFALLCLPVVLGAYAVRLLPARTAKQTLLRLFFRGDRIDDARQTLGAHLDRWLPSRRNPFGAPRLQEHLDAGHRVVILSASPDVYVPLIAERMGVREWVCTEVEVEDGVITGRIVGNNLTDEAKVEAISRFLGETASAEIHAYGNSQSDLPVLRHAHRGFMVSKKGVASIETHILPRD